MSVQMMDLNFSEGYKTNLRLIPSRDSLHYTRRYSKERLDGFRLMGDPLADAVTESLHYKHGGLVHIHDLLDIVEQKAKIEGEDGEVFRRFRKESGKIPDWADEKIIERGQEIHAMLTPFIGISLFSGSLVGGGQFTTAAVVTALAGNITTDPTRRITETGMLLMALAFPGSLYRQGGEANDSLTRVRLLHAALRTWLPTTNRLAKHKELVPARVYVEGEVPINQQDLAITLGIFCYLNLRSLRRMSIILHKKDVEAYVMMWRYAGYVLGIHEDLLPKSLEDQEEFMLASMLHQGCPEWIEEHALKNFIDAFAQDISKKTYGVVRPMWMNSYLQQMTRYLNGEDYVTGMKIKDFGDYHWSVIVTKTLGYLVGTVLPRLPYGERFLMWRNIRAAKMMLKKRGIPTGHGAGTGADITSAL